VYSQPQPSRGEASSGKEVVRRRHVYPAARADRRPSHWWYWGRAIYVSRRDYWSITRVFLTAGLPLGAYGVLARDRRAFRWALHLAEAGFALLGYSLFGLYRMYGHPSMRYYERLVQDAGLRGKLTIADLHIGTWRTAYALADLLPDATIHSVDCWNKEGDAAEAAIADVRDLEPAPDHRRIHPARATDFKLPLAAASCDVVVFGFGTHEIPEGTSREQLFKEAERVLCPGGRVLLFEHGQDLHNFLIFGPVIHHVTKREDWMRIMRAHFDDVRYARSSAAVDLITARRR
jgi:SAM-dependent methyltransferase